MGFNSGFKGLMVGARGYFGIPGSFRK